MKFPSSWQWIAATAAVLLGAAAAYHQWSSSGPELRHSARSGHDAPSEIRARTPTAKAGDEPTKEALPPASTLPDPHPETVESREDPNTEPSGDHAAPLPEFFSAALRPEPGTDPEALEEGSPQALQARMEQEARDENWAPRVEWHLENYLGLREHSETLGSPTVECRSTVCRVMSVTDKATLAATPDADWHDMMSHLQYETVSNEFAGSAETIVFNHAEPDRVGFVTYLERATDPEQEAGALE